MSNDTTIVDHILMHDGPVLECLDRSPSGVKGAYMPISQTMFIVTSEDRILASTSHECKTVSPTSAY